MVMCIMSIYLFTYTAWSVEYLYSFFTVFLQCYWTPDTSGSFRTLVWPDHLPLSYAIFTRLDSGPYRRCIRLQLIGIWLWFRFCSAGQSKSFASGSVFGWRQMFVLWLLSGNSRRLCLFSSSYNNNFTIFILKHMRNVTAHTKMQW